jgi:DNA-directed RNA polymerase specialized sigma24 family protein
MKAIAVRTAIKHYHRTKSHNLIFPDLPPDTGDTPDGVVADVTDEYLIGLVNALPDGCRLVFNLFAIEGYTHAEISALLKINEGTSRSQLHHAKFLLKEKLKCQSLAHYYEKFA